MKSAKPIPFDFIIDALYPLHPVTKSMFGTTAVYVGAKMVLALKDNKKDPATNGVWISIEQVYHPELLLLIPSVTTFEIYGIKTKNWLLLPSSSANFEKEVNIICDLIKRNDKRIGKNRK
jgi:hypothetical protein